MVASFFLLFLNLILLQNEIPHKPSLEYETKIEYIFKDKPMADRYKANYDQASEDQKLKPNSGPLPYLIVQLNVLKVSDKEVKIRVIDKNGKLIFTRKAVADTQIKLDWGFSADIKESLVTNEFTVLFIDERKKPVSKIHLLIQEDGTFLVNNEKRGKF